MITIKKEGYAELIEKKSKFIANVFPVETEEEALEKLAMVKKKYSDARHNVYAYNIGGEIIRTRYSDDGEPQGTAGLPVLNVIKGQAIENILIVVTRYFGGILLGTGGLVRAYTDAAKLGVEDAEVIEEIEKVKLSLDIEYEHLEKVKNFIEKSNYDIDNIEYSDNVKIYVLIPLVNEEDAKKEMINLLNAKVVINKIG